MNVSGFSFWYPMLMCMTIFGGSLKFVAVSMLMSPFAPLQVLLTSLMVQARHLFYGSPCSISTKARAGRSRI